MVHVPVEGSPLRVTFPGVMQSAGLIFPIEGAVGTEGAGSMIALEEEAEVHNPTPTVNVYVFAPSPDIVVEVPVPTVVALPGVRVIVQAPPGSPVNSILPVPTEHVGWVTKPIVGGLIVPTITVIGIATLFPQLVTPVTLRLPVAIKAKLAVMVFVFTPAVIEKPDPE